MTAQEHYREAERLLDEAERVAATATPETAADVDREAAVLLAHAQVHATLSLAGTAAYLAVTR